MTRIKRGTMTHKRHKKIIKAAKGFSLGRKNKFRLAKEALFKAGRNAYRDRRLKKRDFRALWTQRINAGCRELGMSYSRFIGGLTKLHIELDRKILAELAHNNKDVFASLVEKAKAV